jgi:phosphohistidine phosphatase
MSQLVLIRHAEARANDSGSDHDRILTKQGIEVAKHLGQIFKDEEITPDVILCSDSKRTQETLKHLGLKDTKTKILFLADIYFANNGKNLVQLMTSASLIKNLVGVDTVYLIGHNPAISDLVEVLTGNPVNLSPGQACLLANESNDWNLSLSIEGTWKQSINFFH